MAKTAKVEVKKVETGEIPSLQELLESGAHFGHSVKRRNPRMDDYVYATKNGVQIFDLVKTRNLLIEACEYVTKVTSEGGIVMLLGTKGQAVEVIRAEATRIGAPFIVNRWVGGLFTNWGSLKTRIEKLLKMKEAKEKGDYKKYTKKEQVVLDRTIERLERMYGGVSAMKELPKVLFMVDPTRETTALREAFGTNVSVIAIVDTNCDPTGIAKVIPANDDALKSVELIVKAIAGAIEKGMKLAKSKEK
jgi:small subunit ribosomal protein S2